MDVAGGKKDASIDDSFDLITPKIIMKANAVNKALAFMFFLDFWLKAIIRNGLPLLGPSVRLSVQGNNRTQHR